MEPDIVPCYVRGNDCTLFAVLRFRVLFFDTRLDFVTGVVMWLPIAFPGSYWVSILEQAESHDNFYPSLTPFYH
jgi:hypothetical protein